MFADFQYTTLKRKVPPQNALFLCITGSYSLGRTLIKETKLVSPYRKDKIVHNHNEQIEHKPKLLRCILTFKYIGKSKVCREVNDNSLELRNRRDPFLSLRAKGVLRESEKITTINIKWVKPKYYYFWIINILLGSFGNDKKTILVFWEEWLKTKIL